MNESETVDCLSRHNLSIWFCESCQSVHFRVGEALMTFSAREFIDFAAVVGDLYGQAYFEVFKQANGRDCLELDLIS